MRTLESSQTRRVGLKKESPKAKAKREAAIAAVFAEAGIQTKNHSWREEYQLDTPVGKLVIVPYEDWVHCQFEDPVAANEAIGNVSPTGKWNHHTNSRVMAADIEAILELLKRYKLYPIAAQISGSTVE